jgi:hypothetical protein
MLPADKSSSSYIPKTRVIVVLFPRVSSQNGVGEAGNFVEFLLLPASFLLSSHKNSGY